MSIINFFRRPSPEVSAAQRLYAALVRHARHPVFYRHLGVPDTVDGRFDMIAVHGCLILRRLRRDSATTAALSQALIDHLFDDMDVNLREMGAGDLGVGTRVKNMAKLFYGRLAAYDSALGAADDTVLRDALRRNLYRKAAPPDSTVAAVAAYVRRVADALDRLPTARFADGEIDFGPPPSVD